MDEDLNSQNSECHICNSFYWGDFFDLVAVDEIYVVRRDDQGIFNFFVVRVFGREVKYGPDYAEDVLFRLEFFLYQ